MTIGFFQSATMIRNRNRRYTRITVPTASSLDFSSDSVTSRLERIADHYVELDTLLATLEAKIPPVPAPGPALDATAQETTVRKPR